MMNLKHFKHFICIAVAILMLVGAGGVKGQTGTANDFQERLFIANFILDRGLDVRYQQESRRLLEICQFYSPECFGEHFTEVRQRIATLRSEPGSGAEVVGHLVAVIKVSGREYGGLTIGIDVETADDPVRTGTWRETVGDWGYGIYVMGVRPREEWLQLTNLPIVGHAWVSKTEPSLSAHVSAFEGTIVNLQPLVAAFPDGNSRSISAGSYLIKEVTDGRVRFRAEIPTDFACGHPAERPDVMPPILHAGAAEFFNEDGTPRFSVKYQRGC